MNIKTIVLATTFLLSGAFAFAESVHLPQAMEHTKAAITHGEAGYASVGSVALVSSGRFR